VVGGRGREVRGEARTDVVLALGAYKVGLGCEVDVLDEVNVTVEGGRVDGEGAAVERLAELFGVARNKQAADLGGAARKEGRSDPCRTENCACLSNSTLLRQ